MSFWTSLKKFFVTSEQDVLGIIVKIKQDVDILESDISAALKWIADNTPAIAADIESVLSVVQAIGIPNPAVQVAVTAANEAVLALNAYATAYKNGTGTAQAVIAGYSALKQAQAAAANAASAAVSAAPKTS